jgi:hypothetical protein
LPGRVGNNPAARNMPKQTALAVVTQPRTDENKKEGSLHFFSFSEIEDQTFYGSGSQQ